MNLLGKAFCEWCGAYHPLNIYYEYVPLDVHGIRFEALEVYARCCGCGQKIYVPEINDVNAVIRKTEYVKAKRRKEGERRMTNGDRIRAMTDEELAEECGFRLSCEECEEIIGGCEKYEDIIDGHGAATYEYCIGRWLKWLKMEGEG